MEDYLPLAAEVEAWEVAVVDVVADVADAFVVVVAAAVVERVEVVALEAWTKLELRCCYGQEVALATS